MESADHHGAQNNLGPESPVSSGKQPIGRRKSSMRLELLGPEEDDDMLEEGASSSRRPSTCSLSRFRSCPQLAAAAQRQDSPSIDLVDDDYDIPSPTAGHRRLYTEERERCPRTPTPPSTPGSRRSHMSLKENSHRIAGLSPSSTPKLPRSSKPRDFKLIGRTSSGESGTQDHMSFSSVGVQISMRDENSIRFDDFSDRMSSRPEAGMPSISFNDRLSDHAEEDKRHHQQHAVHDDSSHDKCKRWLQSLKITRADRIKSRSHIQLPPI